MEFRFKSDKLKLLYTQEEGAHRYPAAIVKRFFEVMYVIEAIPNEGGLYSCVPSMKPDLEVKVL